MEHRFSPMNLDFRRWTRCGFEGMVLAGCLVIASEAAAQDPFASAAETASEILDFAVLIVQGFIFIGIIAWVIKMAWSQRWNMVGIAGCFGLALLIAFTPEILGWVANQGEAATGDTILGIGGGGGGGGG